MPAHWSLHLHYDVVLAPVAMALLITLLRKSPPPWRRRLAAAGVLLVVAQGGVWSGQQRWWSQNLTRTPAAQQAALHLTRHLPQDTPVVTDQPLGPALVPHLRVRMLDTAPHGATAAYVLLDLSRDTLGAGRKDKQTWLATLPPDAQVAREDPVVLISLQRPGWVSLPGCHAKPDGHSGCPHPTSH